MESNQGGRWTGLSWLKFARGREDMTAYEPGGTVILASAAAAVINSGDLVFLSATGFNKSATQANYVGFKGVAVGGKLTDNQAVFGTGRPLTTGVVGESLLVQVDGIAIVVAGGAITVGTHFTVIPDTGTAGRVIAGTTAGQVVGNTITVGVLAEDMRILLSPR